MLGGPLEALQAAIADLSSIDAGSLDDTTLHDTVVALAGLRIRIEALHCQVIAAWDHRQLWAADGSKAAGARLARETHLRRSDTDRLVHRGRDLVAMPHTAEAYAAGEINGAHVDLVASCNREWRNADFAESEQFLVDLCRTPYYGVAHRGVEYWKQLADRDAADRDANTVRDGRHLSASVGWRGELVIDGALDPLGGEIVKTELDRIGEQLRLQDQHDGVTRTATQRRADALVEMATRSATAPADGLRPRPLLTVTIGIDPFNHLCQTAAGTVIAPGLLMPYLSDTDLERIVYDPPARRFEASHRRRFSGAVRRVIAIRDGQCQHTSGCDEPASRCDVDHIIPHGDGVTCLCNGQLLCAHHNRTVKAATRPSEVTPRPCPYDQHQRPAADAGAGAGVEDATTTRAPPATG